MGSARIKPDRLGEKLSIIRGKFGFSLAEMAAKLSDDKISVARQDIHRYERGEMAPSIIILLRYSRLARVKMEVFADDNLDLPK
jgi:transcriptional regulator with XRE-family HTH domain